LNAWKTKTTADPEFCFKFKPIGLNHGLKHREEKIGSAWAKTKMELLTVKSKKEEDKSFVLVEERWRVCQRVFH